MLDITVAPNKIGVISVAMRMINDLVTDENVGLGQKYAVCYEWLATCPFSPDKGGPCASD